MKNIRKSTLQSVSFLLWLAGLSMLQSCNLIGEDDVDCPVTAEPLTQDDLRVTEDITYRGQTSAELYYIAGDCFNGSGSTQWEYTGEAIFNSPAPSINGFTFMSSGTLCAQLQSDEGKSEKICQEIKVHRDHIWSPPQHRFPGEKTKQTVTMELNGDVYAGFGMNNEWYRFDTLTFEWLEKSPIPNLVDFNAFAGFAIANKGYLIGNNSQLYEYDPSADTWTSKGPLPELVSTILNLGAFPNRGEYAYPVLGVSEGGKGYFGIGNQDRLFEYDPGTNAWTELAKRPIKGTVGEHSFAYQGKIYIGHYVYDITSHAWSKGSEDFSISVGFSPGFVHFKGVMYGGLAGETVTFDGEDVQAVDLEGATMYTNAPTGLYGSGGVTGNFILFPRQMGIIGKDEELFRYYIDK
uniref:Galactose oxidase n=1 Tax=Roseihalotalea indica TaxID=2867963 RepID=A0AA49GQT4_9BACT|nr:hypothetical protein K4G66_08835 [Tunicatimonas sp. TK19036]